jgi:hypothetical protein
VKIVIGLNWLRIMPSGGILVSAVFPPTDPPSKEFATTETNNLSLSYTHASSQTVFPFMKPIGLHKHKLH